MSRALTAIALIAGALLTYMMGAAASWSLDPGDWSEKGRSTLVFLIWPMTCGVVALLLHNSREDR